MKHNSESIEKSIIDILKSIGEDTTREGLVETPKRVAKKFLEIFSGYEMDPDDVLNKKFFQESDFCDYVWLKNIEFHSSCEHHMLPVTGSVDICYIPDGSVVGLSKLARIVDVFSKRLQLQERMSCQIAESIQKNLSPKGVGVRVSAKHYCMLMRGAKKQNSYMETFYFTGVFKALDSNNTYRRDFFSSLKG